MIKLNNVDKYFNKGKQNEIHVINNTSLEFSNKGLVSILGASGSGKTTLLNVIGGLDKATGTIDFDGTVINKYKSDTWDKIRNEKIGYIFQNYHLIESMTVFDNIKLSLTMLGITSKEEIDYKVNYVLEAVGMYRYRRKKAGELSGGQKQRVAIARALVKDPEVIIADEPTGNLDTNNSVEVLKIIKEISKEKLVILVTHNKNLANNFSDRIITVSDGKVISDESDINNNFDLDYIDNNIYLKDLKSEKAGNIKIYADSDISKLNLTIVKINNNYYLQSDENNITIQNVKTTNKKLVDMSKDDVIINDKNKHETDYNSLELNQINHERTHVGVYTFKDSIIMALKKLTNLGRKAKLQIFALILLGVMFSVSFLMLLSSLTLDKSKITELDNLYYYDVNYKRDDYPLFDDSDNFFFTTKGVTLNLRKGLRMQSLYIQVAPVTAIQEEDIGLYEAYMDEYLFTKDFTENYILDGFGLNNKEYIIGEDVSIRTNYNYTSIDLKITKTVNKKVPMIYVSEAMINLLTLEAYNNGFKEYYLFENYNPNITKEIEISSNDINKIPIYISDEYEDLNYEETPLTDIYPLKTHVVKGYFADNLNQDFNNDILNTQYIAFIKSENVQNLIKVLEQTRDYNNYYNYDLSLFNKKDKEINDLYAIKAYDRSLEIMERDRGILTLSSLMQTIFAIGISLLIFYFLVRSSLTSRRKEISVLRALGLRKREVRKLFAYEYFIMTLFTSFIGVVLGIMFTKVVFESVFSGFINIRVNFIFALLTILVTFVLNIFIGLIPVNGVLRKTPAEILTNYDM